MELTNAEHMKSITKLKAFFLYLDGFVNQNWITRMRYIHTRYNVCTKVFSSWLIKCVTRGREKEKKMAHASERECCCCCLLYHTLDCYNENMRCAKLALCRCVALATNEFIWQINTYIAMYKHSWPPITQTISISSSKV